MESKPSVAEWASTQRRIAALDKSCDDSQIPDVKWRWSETDFTEFFGVAATSHDDVYSYSFEVARDGLRLLVTIFDLEQEVRVSIFRDGLADPIFTVRREFCTHAHIAGGAGFRRCFEAGKSKHPVTDMGIPPVLERGVRVYVEPHFQIEFIQPRYENI